MIHRMNKLRRTLLLTLICLLLCLPMTAGGAEDPAPYIRVGLYWGDRALEGANLLNYVGSGYDLGYFDGNREFIPLMHTEEKGISMLKDWSL